MRGHYFLKWLFLTVFSVSILHFREAVPAGRYRFEQTNQNLVRKTVFNFKHFKPSAKKSIHVAHLKNAQFDRLLCLSTLLTDASESHLAFNLRPTVSRICTQNQHFHSRSLSCDDHRIEHS